MKVIPEARRQYELDIWLFFFSLLNAHIFIYCIVSAILKISNGNQKL